MTTPLDVCRLLQTNTQSIINEFQIWLPLRAHRIPLFTALILFFPLSSARVSLPYRVRDLSHSSVYLALYLLVVIKNANLARLNGFILGNHSRAAARRVAQHPIKSRHYLRKVPSVVAADDTIDDPEPMQIADNRLASLFIAVVGKQSAGVFHERRDMSALATRCRA